jgi:hypothetical protein
MVSLPQKKARLAMKPKADKNQLKAFRKAARDLGADQSDERFKDALRKIAKPGLKQARRANKLRGS